MADMVSANTRAGSRPETKVSVQTTLATKPVATFGTSRARAAVSASALSAVVLARMRIRFRRFTGGLRHDASARAGHDGEVAGGGSPDLEIALAEPGSASPIPKYYSNYNIIKIRPHWP